VQKGNCCEKLSQGRLNASVDNYFNFLAAFSISKRPYYEELREVDMLSKITLNN